jgi:hypothetical protein
MVRKPHIKDEGDTLLQTPPSEDPYVLVESPEQGGDGGFTETYATNLFGDLRHFRVETLYNTIITRTVACSWKRYYHPLIHRYE